MEKHMGDIKNRLERQRAAEDQSAHHSCLRLEFQRKVSKGFAPSSILTSPELVGPHHSMAASSSMFHI